MLISTATMIRAEPSASHRMPIRNAERDERVELPVLLERAELLVLDRDRSGQPHAGAVFGLELEIGGGLADRAGRGCARLERGEVEHRLDLDDAPQVALASAPCGSPVRATRSSPACRRRPSSSVVANIVSGRVISSSVYILRWMPGEAEGQRLHQAAQGRVGDQHLEQRLRLGELGGEVLHLLVRREQQARAAGRIRSR